LSVPAVLAGQHQDQVALLLELRDLVVECLAVVVVVRPQRVEQLQPEAGQTALNRIAWTFGSTSSPSGCGNCPASTR
jgi:hypothetical protein